MLIEVSNQCGTVGILSQDGWRSKPDVEQLEAIWRAVPGTLVRGQAVVRRSATGRRAEPQLWFSFSITRGSLHAAQAWDWKAGDTLGEDLRRVSDCVQQELVPHFFKMNWTEAAW